MNLTGFALRNQPLVAIVTLALVVFAGMALQNFPSQEDPPITVREAVVTTLAPGMDSEDVELLVTRHVEKALARTDGCALNGAPDGNGPGRDWITDCAEQLAVYASLSEALDALDP